VPPAGQDVEKPSWLLMGETMCFKAWKMFTRLSSNRITRLLAVLKMDCLDPLLDDRNNNQGRPKEGMLRSDGFFAFAYESLAEPMADMDDCKEVTAMEGKEEEEEGQEEAGRKLEDWIFGAENPVAAAGQAGLCKQKGQQAEGASRGGGGSKRVHDSVSIGLNPGCSRAGPAVLAASVADGSVRPVCHLLPQGRCGGGGRELQHLPQDVQGAVEQGDAVPQTGHPREVHSLRQVLQAPPGSQDGFCPQGGLESREHGRTFCIAVGSGGLKQLLWCRCKSSSGGT
jgi:hypothetical protein